MTHFWALVLTMFAPHLANRMLRLSFVWSVISFAMRMNVSPQVLRVALANLHFVLTTGNKMKTTFFQKKERKKDKLKKKKTRKQKKTWQNTICIMDFHHCCPLRPRRGKGAGKAMLDRWVSAFVLLAVGMLRQGVGGVAASPPTGCRSEKYDASKTWKGKKSSTTGQTLPFLGIICLIPSPIKRPAPTVAHARLRAHPQAPKPRSK